MMRFFCSLTIALAFAVAGSRAVAGERLLVIIETDQETAREQPSLSDNLTEIAIAELAEGYAREMIGVRELRRVLAGALDGERLAGCLSRAPCLSHVGEVAGAPRALIGTVGRQNGAFALALTVTDIRTMATLAKTSRLVPMDDAALIAAVRESVAELVAQRLAPAQAPASPPKGGLVPPLLEKAAEPPPRFLPLAGYGAGGLSVVLLSAGMVTGALAEQSPSGTTRSEKQADLAFRIREANVANVLLVSGAILAACSAAILIWHARHDGASGQ